MLSTGRSVPRKKDGAGFSSYFSIWGCAMTTLSHCARVIGAAPMKKGAKAT